MCIENAIIFLFSVLLKSIELIKMKRSHRNKLDRRHFKYGTSEMNERMNDSFIGICNSIPRAFSQVIGTGFVYDYFLHSIAFQHAATMESQVCLLNFIISQTIWIPNKQTDKSVNRINLFQHEYIQN